MKPDLSLLRVLVKLHTEVPDIWSTEVRRGAGFQSTVIFSAQTDAGFIGLVEAFGLTVERVTSVSGANEWMEANGVREGIAVRVTGPHRPVSAIDAQGGK